VLVALGALAGDAGGGRGDAGLAGLEDVLNHSFLRAAGRLARRPSTSFSTADQFLPRASTSSKAARIAGG
jgi:hypothetical protein